MRKGLRYRVSAVPKESAVRSGMNVCPKLLEQYHLAQTPDRWLTSETLVSQHPVLVRALPLRHS